MRGMGTAHAQPSSRWDKLCERLALPVFTKEMRTRMRGMRTTVLLFASTALAIVVAIVLFSWMAAPGDAVTVSKALIGWLALLEGALIALIAPALTASSITFERDQGTLEALLLTPLSTRGILLGKLCSALSLVVYILLSVLPVMAVSFLLGGVSPAQVAWALALILAMASLFGAIGLYASARFRHSVSSMCIAYAGCLTWLVLIPGALLLQHSRPDQTSSFFEPHALLDIIFAMSLPMICAPVAAMLYHKLTHHKASRLFKTILYSSSVIIGATFIVLTSPATDSLYVLLQLLILAMLSLPFLVLTAFIYRYFRGKSIGTRVKLLFTAIFAILGFCIICVLVNKSVNIDADIYLFGNPGMALWRLLFSDSGQPWAACYLPPVTVALLLIGAWMVLVLAERQLERQRGCRTEKTSFEEPS